MLGHNELATEEDLAPLACLAQLEVLDLQSNRLLDVASALHVLAVLPLLAVLHLQGNPLVAATPHYRRSVLGRLQSLTFLDDRPVFPAERIGANAAWVVTQAGGSFQEAAEAEAAALSAAAAALREEERARSIARSEFVERTRDATRKRLPPCSIAVVESASEGTSKGMSADDDDNVLRPATTSLSECDEERQSQATIRSEDLLLELCERDVGGTPCTASGAKGALSEGELDTAHEAVRVLYSTQHGACVRLTLQMDQAPGLGPCSLVKATGSFSDWNRTFEMVQRDGAFSCEVTIPYGRHLVKFIVNGIWTTSNSLPTTWDDGHLNNYIVVDMI